MFTKADSSSICAIPAFCLIKFIDNFAWGVECEMAIFAAGKDLKVRQGNT